MPDTSPTPVDLDVLEAACKETGQGLWHDVSLALITELRSARIELADEIKWRNRILDRSRASIGPDSHEGWCQTRCACDCGKHVQRPVVMKDDQTYCSCGRPWPCPLAASIGPDSERIREVEAEEIIASYLDPPASISLRASWRRCGTLGCYQARTKRRDAQAVSRWLRPRRPAGSAYPSHIRPAQHSKRVYSQARTTKPR